MHICTECGRVTEEDMDFCPHCGSVKGANVDKELLPDDFKVVTGSGGTYIMRTDVRRIRMAIILALIPGILNVFGLGQIYMRRFVRGIAFLACSVFYFIERFLEYFGIDYWVLVGFTLAVFALQLFDIFRIVKAELGVAR